MQKMADLSELIDDPNQDIEEDYIFNEYAIDDTLDPLSRLVRYHQSDFSLQRLMLVRELSDTALYAGYVESVKVIVSLLPQFTSDAEPSVRQALVQQLYPLAKFFVEEGGEEGYEFLLTTFLPMNFELLVDKNVEVGAEALTTMLKMSELIRTEHVQKNLLSSVITLAHDERAEDYRVVAAQLFNDLASKFGEQCCTNIILPELELLSNDSSFSVRKAVGEKLGGICKAVNDVEAKKEIVTLYLNLCGDDIWGVRQACAQSVEEIASSVPEEIRINDILPAFRTMIDDGSRWVRNRAHEYFGHLVHTLTSDDISPELLELYTEMAFQSESGDCEYSEYCAFCFPAVVEAIGPNRWNEVQDAYATMLKDVQWKVRKSLAYSLHEIATILGTDLTEECIVPAFELFLRDLDDIKRGVVINVSSFLKIVRPKTLNRLVPLLCQVPLESENWRLRNEVAMRIGEVALLLSPNSPAFLELIGLVLRLLEDSVIKVRNSAYRPAAMILKILIDAEQANLGNYLNAITDLAKRATFQGREMFVYVVQQVVEIGADEVVEKYLLKNLRALAADSVSNVRLVVEKVIRETFLPREFWRNHAIIQEIVTIAKSQNIEDDEENKIIAAALSEVAADATPTLALNATLNLQNHHSDADQICLNNTTGEENGTLRPTESVKVQDNRHVPLEEEEEEEEEEEKHQQGKKITDNISKDNINNIGVKIANGVKEQETVNNATSTSKELRVESKVNGMAENNTHSNAFQNNVNRNDDNDNNIQSDAINNLTSNTTTTTSNNNNENGNNSKLTNLMLEQEECFEEEEETAHKQKRNKHTNGNEVNKENEIDDNEEEEERFHKLHIGQKVNEVEENEEDEVSRQTVKETKDKAMVADKLSLLANGKMEHNTVIGTVMNGLLNSISMGQNNFKNDKKPKRDYIKAEGDLQV